MCAPSKYYTYLFAGKPIISVMEPDSYISKEVFKIATISLLQGAANMVAFKEVDLVFEFVRSVILWCSRKQADVREDSCLSANLLYQFVKRPIHIGIAVTEFMALIYYDKTIMLVLQG